MPAESGAHLSRHAADRRGSGEHAAPPAHVPAPAPQVMTKLPWDVVMQRWTTYVDRDVLLRLHAFARKLASRVPKS